MANEAADLKKKLETAKQAATDFLSALSYFDGGFDSKETELRSLELKVSELKKVDAEMRAKASSILQQASDEAAKFRNDAKRLMMEAQERAASIEQNFKESEKKLREADARIEEAKKRESDLGFRASVVAQREKKIEKALNS